VRVGLAESRRGARTRRYGPLSSTTELLAAEPSRTHPLLRTMPEKITASREGARGRTVSAR
ncbi:MAG: hypothetical protein P8Y15_12880, partial [Gemmatimonadales bacterium]